MSLQQEETTPTIQESDYNRLWFKTNLQNNAF